jgi:hypothetical protein
MGSLMPTTTSDSSDSDDNMIEWNSSYNEWMVHDKLNQMVSFCVTTGNGGDFE